MGVADTARHLYQLADMPHEEHVPETGVRRHHNGVINEVGGSHCRLQRKAVFLQKKSFAVVAGRGGQDRQPLLFPDPDLHQDRIQQSLIAHRFHDPARSEDGNPSFDTQFGIKGLFRQPASLRDGNRDVQPGRKGILPAFSRGAKYLQNRLRDHPSGGAVDGRVSHRLVQPRFRHPPYALSSVDPDSRCVGAGCRGIDQNLICDVRIISAVLADSAGDGRKPCISGSCGMQFPPILIRAGGIYGPKLNLTSHPAV